MHKEEIRTTPPSFGDTGLFRLQKEVVRIVKWKRPYGVPYAVTDCGHEVHPDQFILKD